MALPATTSLLFNTVPKLKYLIVVAIAFIGFAIIILKCRTAYIGSIISIVMVLNFYYQPILKLQSHLKSIKLLVITVPVISCLSLLLLSLYKMKMASADGRLLIWKISLGIIPHHLLAGVGLGNFEQVYNLNQADYFNNSVFTQVEMANASFVNMAYNDFLQNSFEGGIIGFALFTVFLLSLLIKYPTYNKKLACIAFSFIGITSFTIMCCFNFMMEAVPVICLCIVYASVIVCTKTDNRSINSNSFLNFWQKPLAITQPTKNIFTIVFLLIAITFLFKQLVFAKAAIAGDAKGWYNLGLAYKYGLAKKQDFEKANTCFKKAADMNDPDGWYAQGYMLYCGFGCSQD